MNKITSILLGGTLMAAFTLPSFGAGPLTPPGTPGQPVADMPSLVEIKAAIDALAASSTGGLNGRTAIPGTIGAPAAGPAFVISAPGSYVLTGNVTVSSGNGINITSSDVTLDLNGFTIASTAATLGDGYGIGIAGPGFIPLNGVRVLNGHIKSGTTYNGVWVTAGFHTGIKAQAVGSGAISNMDVEGCKSYGISDDGNQMLIDHCTVASCSAYGIVGGIIRNSSATTCGSVGVQGSRVTGCYGEAVGAGFGEGNGIVAPSVTDSTGVARGAGNGISGAQIVHNCTGSSWAGIGISCAVASYCSGQSESGVTAINATQSAIGCSTIRGAITSPSKHLGTP